MGNLARARELLCALSGLCQPNCLETVTDRVEPKVACAMLPRPLTIVTAGASRKTTRDPSDIWYEDWLVSGHDARCSAMKEAVLKEFNVKDNDESVCRRLTKAYKALKESNDPAIRYYIRTLTYLPEGSQESIPDAIPETWWFDADKTDHTFGLVVTVSAKRSRVALADLHLPRCLSCHSLLACYVGTSCGLPLLPLVHVIVTGTVCLRSV